MEYPPRRTWHDQGQLCLPLPGMETGTESQSLIWEGCRQAPKAVSTAVLGDRTGRFTFAWENHTGKDGR